jgi:hypothetical protein
MVYEDLGHAPHWEAPKHVAGDIARFVLEQAAKITPRRVRAG